MLVRPPLHAARELSTANMSRLCASAISIAMACSAITGESMPRMLVTSVRRSFSAGTLAHSSMPADNDASQRSSRAALMMRASQISGLSPMMTSASAASRIAAALLAATTTVAPRAAAWNTAGSLARKPYCSSSTLRGSRQPAMSRARVGGFLYAVARQRGRDILRGMRGGGQQRRGSQRAAQTRFEVHSSSGQSSASPRRHSQRRHCEPAAGARGSALWRAACPVRPGVWPGSPSLRASGSYCCDVLEGDFPAHRLEHLIGVHRRDHLLQHRIRRPGHPASCRPAWSPRNSPRRGRRRRRCSAPGARAAGGAGASAARAGTVMVGSAPAASATRDQTQESCA